MRGGLGDHSGEVFTPVHRDQLSGQYAGIDTAYFGDAQELTGDARDHQADGIHVGSNEQAGSRLRGGTAFQGVQAAQLAGADLIRQRSPGFSDDLAHGRFVTAQARGRNKLFQ